MVSLIVKVFNRRSLAKSLQYINTEYTDLGGLTLWKMLCKLGYKVTTESGNTTHLIGRHVISPEVGTI